jgi:hypothetical protein
MDTVHKRLYVFAIISAISGPALADVERRKFTSGDRYLVVEVLDDDLVHFEVCGSGTGPSPNQPWLKKRITADPRIFTVPETWLKLASFALKSIHERWR